MSRPNITRVHPETGEPIDDEEVELNGIVPGENGLWSKSNGEVTTDNPVSIEETVTERLDSRKHIRTRRNRWSFDLLGAPVGGKDVGMFEDLSGSGDDYGEWENLDPTDAEVEVETDNPYRGTQCVRAVYQDGADEDTWRFRYEPTEAFSIGYLSMAINVPEGETSRRVRIRVRDNSGNTYRVDFRHGSKDPFNEWMKIDFGTGFAGSAVDSDDIDWIQIEIHGWEDEEILVDAVTHTPRIDKAGVLFIADNFHDFDYASAFDVFDEYNQVFHPAVNEHWTDASSYGVGELQEMQEAGMEPIVKGEQGLIDMSATDRREQVESHKEWFHEYGFIEGAEYIVPHGNAWDHDLHDLFQEYFAMATTRGESAVGWHLTNPYLIGRESIDSGTSNAESMIEIAAEMSEVVPIYWHGNNISESDLESVLDKMEAEGVDSIPIQAFHNEQLIQ